jgi:hypothetical protein
MARIWICLALVVAATTAASWAQPQAGAGAASQPVCGGIGQGEQQRMKDAARDHDHMLTFASANGSYLADVSVQVRDGRGATVFAGTCDGPILLLDVPAAGSYRIAARAGGIVRERTVTVARGKRPASATFIWPDGTS